MNGPLAINFEALWQEGMHDWQGNMPKRMVDDTLEEAFWQQSIAKKVKGQTDPHAQPIFDVIKHYLSPSDSVLEIGPGWGNYTFPAVDYVNKVTCVDSSKSVLAYLQNCMAQQDNVQYVHGKWEEVNVPQHDVVFGVNCFYRMYYMVDTLKKMNALAKKRVVIGLTTGPIQPHYVTLHEQYGYAIKFPRRDYIEIVNMLYQMGIYADCQMLPLERVYSYPTMDKLIDAQSKKIRDEQFDRAHVKAALLPFITEDEQGIHYTHTFYAAVISWRPVKEQIR